MENHGEFTIDLVLFEPDNLTLEVDFYIQSSNPYADSDWDSRNHLEIYEYRVYSMGSEIELDLDDKYLYDLLRGELRKRELERYCDGGL